MRFSKGFTLIELMIVLAIVGILAMVGLLHGVFGSVSGQNQAKATEAATACSAASM